MGRVAMWVVAGLLMVPALSGSAGAYEEPSVEQLQWELRQELSQEMDADDWFGTTLTLGLLGEAAYPVLLDALRDPNPVLRANAIEALATTSDAEGGLPAESRAAMENALHDPDPRVREAARISLNGLDQQR